LFVFNGYGFITLILGFASIIGFGLASKNELILQYLNGAESGAIICCIASWINVRIGVYLNSKPARILIDPKTMEKFELKNHHSFFWVPMEYWSFVSIALGILFSYTNIMKNLIPEL